VDFLNADNDIGMTEPAVPVDWNDVAFLFELRRYPSVIEEPETRWCQNWSVKFRLESDAGDEVDRVGYAEIVVVRWAEAEAAGSGGYEVLDGHSAELEKIGVALFDDDTLSPAVEDLVDAMSGALMVLNRVWIDPKYRGQDLGPRCAAFALLELRALADFVVCFPSPFEVTLPKEDRAAAIRALGQIWARVGFEPFKDGVWLLGLATTRLDLAARELGVLA